jgi:hypothetical protein
MDPTPTLIAARSSCDSIDEFTQEYLCGVPMPVVMSLADGAPAPDTIATEARVDFTERAVIAMFRGRFQTLRIAKDLPVELDTGKSPQLWVHSDVYEFFIGPNSCANGRYKEFQVAPDGRFLDIHINQPDGMWDPQWCSGMQCRSFVDDVKKLWMAVIRIPWNSFGVNHRFDNEWNANLYRASGAYHGDELLAWSPTGYGEHAFHRFEHFGRILFEK